MPHQTHYLYYVSPERLRVRQKFAELMGKPQLAAIERMDHRCGHHGTADMCPTVAMWRDEAMKNGFRIRTRHTENNQVWIAIAGSYEDRQRRKTPKQRKRRTQVGEK